MLAAAQLAEAAASREEVVADLVDLLDGLLDLADVLAAAQLAGAALAREVVVAHLVDLLDGLVGTVARLALALGGITVFAFGAGLTRGTRGLFAALEAGTVVVFAVEEAAAVAVLARLGLLPVEALSTRRRLDGLALGVEVLAVVAVAATALVAEGAVPWLTTRARCVRTFDGLVWAFTILVDS